MKLPTLATVNGATLSGTASKAFNTQLVQALESQGFSEGARSTITTSQTLTVSATGLILVDATSASVVLTLPTSGSATDDVLYMIRRIDATANTVTVQRGGTDTIEGATTALAVLPAGMTEVQMPAGATNWRVLAINGATQVGARTALGFTSPVIDRQYVEYATNADLTTVIPGDDTIPQNTEGTQIITVSFTPKSATNRIRLRFQCEFSASAANVAAGAAIFSSASANALRANFASAYGIGFAHPLVVEHEYVPGVTTALTFTVRVGPLSAATIRLNGTTGGRLFGGAMAATLVVEEIAA